MDKYGYHSLHCKYGEEVISRHNKICHEVYKIFKKADLS